MEKAAVADDGLVIPLVDISKFISGNPAQRTETAEAIVHGFRTAGFVYLCGLPISRETRADAFARSARFFAQPAEAKEAIAWTTPEVGRGYSAPGREKVTQLTDAAKVRALRSAMPDIKESLEIGREGVPERPNRWPEDDMGGFRAAMVNFHDECKALHVEVMRAIAVGLGLDDPCYFDRFIDAGDNNMRLLHYPAVPTDAFKTGQVRAGAHTDYGSVTLLFQDERGGLQVQSPNGHFIDAPPIPDTCVVNAGDLLALWSNDAIKSTMHRVVEPTSRVEGDMQPPRYSIAYFCNPNFTSYIETIPGTYSTEADRKYPGINSGQYLTQRLTATYQVAASS